MDTDLIVSKLERFWRWLNRHPISLLVVSIVMMVYVVFRIREKSSSAGVFVYMIIAVFLFMIALGNFTGMGFSMSF